MTVKEMRAELRRMVAIEKQQKANEALVKAEERVAECEKALEAAKLKLAIAKAAFDEFQKPNEEPETN